MNEKPVLILGIGNKILTDDGIGIRLIEDLQHRFDPGMVDFKTACCGGLEIVELMQGYEEVILLDAIKTRSGKPGVIYCFTLEDFKDTLHISNFHDISFLIALDFGKKSGLEIPEHIKILAIEIVEDMVFDEEFSPPIRARYREIREEVFDLLQNQLETRHFSKEETIHE